MLVGEFINIGGDSYIQINKGGTLVKLKKLPWYKILWYAIKSQVKGKIHISEFMKEKNDNT